jgi:hypothetical protein
MSVPAFLIQKRVQYGEDYLKGGVTHGNYRA